MTRFITRAFAMRHPRSLVAIGLLSTVGLLAGCAFAPGSHMEYRTESAPIDDLVDIEPITLGLLATWNRQDATASAMPASLEQALAAYDYRVGPGDVLSIIVYDHPELTIPAGSERSAAEAGNRVRADGTFFYPYIGRVDVAGMNLEEIRQLLTRRLSQFLADPQIEVGVAAYNSKKVYLSGQVNQPRTLPITSVPLTVLDAISQVGSANPQANWHEVFLTRNGQQERLSLYALMRHGDQTQNRLLEDGDILYVPSAENQAVAVMGQVISPGSLPVGNERLSLTDAIARSGGIDERSAEASGIFVIRGEPELSDKIATVYQLNVKNAAAFTLGNHFQLQPQDVVYVTTAPLARWNRVISLLLPSVNLPGTVTRVGDDIRDL
jgi:polysaccharide export outer membrane protein